MFFRPLNEQFAETVPSKGDPSSFGDVFDATVDSQRKVENVFSGVTAKFANYEDRIGVVKAATGQVLQNPYLVSRSPFDLDSKDPFNEFDFQLQDLAQKYPDKAHLIRPDLLPREMAAAGARQSEQRLADVSGRYQGWLGDWAPSWLPSLPGLAGGFRGSIEDPANLASMAVGPMGRVGTGAKAVLWQGVKQGAANSATEAASQPFVMAWKREAGIDTSYADAARSILGAGVFGFGADAGLRGVYRGVQGASGRVPVVNAKSEVTGYLPAGPQDKLSRRAGDAAGAPDAAGAGRDTPVAPRDPEAALEAVAGRSHAGSTVAKAARGDLDALETMVKATGVSDDPGMQGALHAAHTDEQFRTHVAAELGDAVDHGLAFDRIDQHLDAAVRHDGVTPRGLDAVPAPRAGEHPDLVAARTAARDGTDPLDMAVAIRERPEIVDTSLPLHEPRIEAARNLARLSEDAFAEVSSGRVSVAAGQLVGDLVQQPHLHGQVLRAIAKADARTPAQARAVIAREVEGANIDPAVHAKLGIEAPAERVPLKRDGFDAGTPEAKAQLDALRIEHAPALKSIADAEAARAKPAQKLPGQIEVDSFNSIVHMWEFVRDTKRAKAPESLVEFLRRRGGIVDASGDVVGTLGAANMRPGLISRRGQRLDDAARAAWDAGYLHGVDRPEINDLLEALDQELRGDKRYTAADAARADDIAVAKQMEQDLAEIGIRDAKTEADVRRILAEGNAQIEGRTRVGRIEEGVAGASSKAVDRASPELAAAMQDVSRVQHLADLVAACKF